MINDAPRDRGPDVKFPPPFLFAGGVSLGLLLDRVLPDVMPVSRAVQATGVALGAVGLVVVYAGIVTFHKARTAIYPNRPAVRVVAHGVYAYTRNPMYLGLTLLYVGIALLAASEGALLLLPVVHLLLHRFVIAREERYLHHAFPGEYTAYCAEVRRWF